MADPKFPYVKWRDGRPRSSHGAYARALGFVGGVRFFRQTKIGNRSGAPRWQTAKKDYGPEAYHDRGSSGRLEQIGRVQGVVGRLAIVLSQVHLRHPLPAADA